MKVEDHTETICAKDANWTVEPREDTAQGNQRRISWKIYELKRSLYEYLSRSQHDALVCFVFPDDSKLILHYYFSAPVPLWGLSPGQGLYYHFPDPVCK